MRAERNSTKRPCRPMANIIIASVGQEIVHYYYLALSQLIGKMFSHHSRFPKWKSSHAVSFNVNLNQTFPSGVLQHESSALVDRFIQRLLLFKSRSLQGDFVPLLLRFPLLIPQYAILANKI